MATLGILLIGTKKCFTTLFCRRNKCLGKRLYSRCAISNHIVNIFTKYESPVWNYSYFHILSLDSENILGNMHVVWFENSPSWPWNIYIYALFSVTTVVIIIFLNCKIVVWNSEKYKNTKLCRMKRIHTVKKSVDATVLGENTVWGRRRVGG